MDVLSTYPNGALIEFPIKLSMDYILGEQFVNIASNTK